MPPQCMSRFGRGVYAVIYFLPYFSVFLFWKVSWKQPNNDWTITKMIMPILNRDSVLIYNSPNRLIARFFKLFLASLNDIIFNGSHRVSFKDTKFSRFTRSEIFLAGNFKVFPIFPGNWVHFFQSISNTENKYLNRFPIFKNKFLKKIRFTDNKRYI